MLQVQRTVLSLGHVDNGHGVQCQVAVAGTVPQDSLQPQAGKAGPVITLGTPPRLCTLLQSKALGEDPVGGTLVFSFCYFHSRKQGTIHIWSSIKCETVLKSFFFFPFVISHREFQSEVLWK